MGDLRKKSLQALQSCESLWLKTTKWTCQSLLIGLWAGPAVPGRPWSTPHVRHGDFKRWLHIWHYSSDVVAPARKANNKRAWNEFPPRRGMQETEVKIFRWLSGWWWLKNTTRNQWGLYPLRTVTFRTLTGVCVCVRCWGHWMWTEPILPISSRSKHIRQKVTSLTLFFVHLYFTFEEF